MTHQNLGKAIPISFPAHCRPIDPDLHVFRKKSYAEGNEGNDTLFQTIVSLV